MAKSKSIYSCTECGATAPRWQGQCPGCSQWNTMVEAVAETAAAKSRFAGVASLAGTAKVQKLTEVSAKEAPRLSSSIPEFDRVLGGGLVAGQVVLIGGDPGVGKSTLLLQSLAAMSESTPALYVSGEESAQQVALRAQRLSLQSDNLDL